MSIEPGSSGRGVAAGYSQPLSEDDRKNAKDLEQRVRRYTNKDKDKDNKDKVRVLYRSSLDDYDVRNPVYRWDTRPYEAIFESGFRARGQRDTPESTYYNLRCYVDGGGRPLDSSRPTNYAFVSTTFDIEWTPSIPRGTGLTQVYRYEIYAPGGILVSSTLGRNYAYRAQDEVAFPLGIAPQYIRSAQLFELTYDRRSGATTRTPGNNILYMNSNFSPQSHPQRQIEIQRPLKEYEVIENGRKIRRKFEEKKFPARSKRAIGGDDIMYEYYREEVTNVKSYIDSAFRSKTRKNEAYLFMKNEYVLIDYAPEETNDKIIQGPKYIVDSFPSLAGTVFGAYGIDAAFGCHDGGFFYTNKHAFIFSGNLCAKIDYAPGTRDDKILEGPIAISDMFSGLQGTDFENGIDAGFESTRDREAYIFNGSNYALLDLDKRRTIAIRPISQGFPVFLRDCYSFTRKIDAAFTSHISNEVYLFKGDQYVRVKFTPGETGDKVLGGPKDIVPYNWPSLKNVLPRKNIGVDFNVPDKFKPDRDQDEL